MPQGNLPIVGVHLDLKYTMPKKSYLLKWVRRLPRLGINTLLIEYEDKFPYRKYPFLAVPEAFAPAELKKFLATARGVGLRVIPLVQTLSHLEFALAHEQLAHLREAPDVPTQICPSNPAAVSFVKDLLREVLTYHEEDEYFHIGADEAWHLGLCPRCAARLQRSDSVAMWAEHVSDIAQFIVQAGKKPIAWDDALRDKPEEVTQLPQALILNSWSYGDTEIVPDKFPWRNVDLYLARGYQVVGSPCLNQGVLIPSPICLTNTAAWARKAREGKMLGLLNTAWACFHVHQPVTWMQIAATGDLMAGKIAEADYAWQSRFLSREYGCKVHGVVGALQALASGWGFRVTGVGRALSPAVYAYTDMVVHFPGGQPERRRRGIYPLDWNEIDFTAIYQKKLAYVRAAEDMAAVHRQVDELLAAYTEAHGPLTKLARRARRHREEARLLAIYADVKLLHTQVFDHLLRGTGNRDKLERRLRSQGRALRQALTPFLEPPSVQRMLRMYWEPPLAVLTGKSCPLAAAPTPVSRPAAGPDSEIY